MRGDVRVDTFIESISWVQIYRLKLEVIPGLARIVGRQLKNHFTIYGYFLRGIGSCSLCKASADPNPKGLFVYRHAQGVISGICVDHGVTVEVATSAIAEVGQPSDSYYMIKLDTLNDLLGDAESADSFAPGISGLDDDAPMLAHHSPDMRWMESSSLFSGAPLSAADRALITTQLEQGTPCIPFIPFNQLLKSMSDFKPAGFDGYYIARFQALYPDGSVKYLYKEEFTLWASVKRWSYEPLGRTYIMLGLDEEVFTPHALSNDLILPEIFYLDKCELFDVDFLDDVQFAPYPNADGVDLAFLPSGESLRLGRVHGVNFFPVALLHPSEERDDASGHIHSFEEWKRLEYPTSSPELGELFDYLIEQLRESLEKGLI